MLQRLAKLILRIGGWTAVGGVPDAPKAVFIAAPHTSNWDGFWALVYKVAVQVDVGFFAKHSLFWFPLSTILRALGGIELNRGSASSAVQQAIDLFAEKDTFYFGLAPEGTRRKTAGWKSGFYRIASGADVPVYLGFLDYRNKRVGIGPRLDLTGDPDADLAVCREFYATIEGRHPEKASPIVFPPPRKHQRTVRSFVRRAGRMTPSQQKALEELWPEMGIDFGPATLDFGEIFGRQAPVVLEIGFGNGETLVQQALDHPDRDFIGVEVHEPGVGHCLLKAREAGISNLRVIMHDAIEVLQVQVPAGALSRVNLYFPDPWPKKRHHKRRILQPAFLELVAERLAPGGTLYIATDWANYATHIDTVMSATARFTCTEKRVHDGEQPLDRPQTKFERRGLKQGHRITDWCFTRNK